jgi:MYND finger
MSAYMMSPKNFCVGVKRSKVLITYHSSGEVLINLEAIVRLLSPGLTSDEMLSRYKQVVKLNPGLSVPNLPDFSVPECAKEACVNCGIECTKSKSRCGSCMQSAIRVYYCSKACQKAHWPVHKPCCRMTLGVFSFDGASWDNLMKAQLKLIRVE